ncbi:unnamed protein product [Rotaria sp. Silwood1]|nr:unnamed protein product [Rotaria sp. Silwood1]CAF4953469.1 unnamed protein product [Rotaria sp. Silwood1]CAF5016814.1 unnamed protein product [Rotaria sp. Silwood1]
MQQSEEEKQGRRRKIASRAKKRREQETDDERRERQSEDTFRHRHRQQRSSSLYAPALRDEFPPESYHGTMDNVCQHCNALHFKEECTSDRHDEFKQCRHYGSVELPDLLPYPDGIRALLQGTDLEARNFRENIRNYNSALTLVFMGAQIDFPQGFGPYCFRIHGQIYHRIGPLHPDPDQRAQFGPFYILDSFVALKERIVNAANENCEDSEVPIHRHIAIHPCSQDLQTIEIIDPNCDPMTYPLLFPHEDKGWYQELEKIDQSRNRERVSMLQFYSYRLAIRPTFSAIHYRGKLFQQYIVDAYVKGE